MPAGFVADRRKTQARGIRAGAIDHANVARGLGSVKVKNKPGIFVLTRVSANNRRQAPAGLLTAHKRTPGHRSGNWGKVHG